MTIKIKFVGLLIAISIIGYTSLSLYHYFFDLGYPTITVQGIEAENHYKGTITGSVNGSDEYKVAEVNILVDGQTCTKFKPNSKQFNYSFTIPTQDLTAGSHVCTIIATNGTHTRHTAQKEIPFHVDNTPLKVSLVKPDIGYKVSLGKTIHLKIHANKELKKACAQLFNNTFACFQESAHSTLYETYLPIPCEQTTHQYPLVITIEDKVGNTVTLTDTVEILPTQFRRQHLNVDQEKINKEKEISMSNDMLEAALEELTKKSPQIKMWEGSFYVPTEIKTIATEYGAIRVTQEKGRYYHKAIDIAGTPKSVIWAPQSGIVVLKDRYHLSGNTVVIDHGFGILSLFFHLDTFAPQLTVGSRIKQGSPIGTLGKTGYASGYHLHWEMRINNIAIDPLQWTMPNF